MNTILSVSTSGDTSITIEDRKHRENFVAYVLNEAAPWHRQHLTRLYQCWEQWNTQFFGGRLVFPYVLLAEPSEPKTYGDCASVSSFGGKSQIRIRPSLLRGSHPHVRSGEQYAEGRFLFVADVLLHEMIHQFHQEVTGTREEAYHGHGPAFRDKCNEIGTALKLSAVRSSKKRGADKDLPSCAQWPHCVRPTEYYEGALCRSDTRPGSATRINRALALLADVAEALEAAAVEVDDESALSLTIANARTKVENVRSMLSVPVNGDEMTCRGDEG